MKTFSLISFVLLPSLTAAVKLWVSSYSGGISTLNLDYSTATDAYTLTTVSAVNGSCGASPSWLTYNSAAGVLYCIDEGISVPNGTLNAFTVSETGALSKVGTQDTIDGGVNGAIYGASSSFLAIAHYGGSAISTFDISTPTAPKAMQEFVFTLAQPGPNPSRQDAPHVHEVVLDPTGKFVLAPDLGADLVRVYSIDAVAGTLTECPALVAAPGSGPRHAAFHVSQDNGQSWLYLTSELANTVSAYNVSYLAAGCMAFSLGDAEDALGPGRSPNGAAVAEIAVRENTMLVSNRNDASFGAQNDSMASYSLAPDGLFTFQGLTPAYGSFPRQFSINAAGDLVAIGLQYTSTVAIIRRDVATGLLGPKVAQIDVQGQVTCTIWVE